MERRGDSIHLGYCDGGSDHVHPEHRDRGKEGVRRGGRVVTIIYIPRAPIFSHSRTPALFLDSGAHRRGDRGRAARRGARLPGNFLDLSHGIPLILCAPMCPGAYEA